MTEVYEGDADRASLLQEFMGYCLTSDTSLQKALALIGKSRSGKGTIQRIIGALVGTANATGYSLDSLPKEFGLESLLDRSVALVGEVELSKASNRAKIVEVFKSITGEDTQSVNQKNMKAVSVRLGVRFVLAANSVPRLLDASGAMGSRLLCINHEVSFLNREDRGLEARLLTELPGIANWALAGLARLRAAGGRFTSTAADAEMAVETAPLLAWLADEMVISRGKDSGDLPPCCLSDAADLSITTTSAFARYQTWCHMRGIEPPSAVWFGRDMGTTIPKVKIEQYREHGVRVRGYVGLGVRLPTDA